MGQTWEWQTNRDNGKTNRDNGKTNRDNGKTNRDNGKTNRDTASLNQTTGHPRKAAERVSPDTGRDGHAEASTWLRQGPNFERSQGRIMKIRCTRAAACNWAGKSAR